MLNTRASGFLMVLEIVLICPLGFNTGGSVAGRTAGVRAYVGNRSGSL